MRYTELLDRFWGMDRKFSEKETILYHYLLYRCNSLGWPDTFCLSNEELIGALRCRHTAMRDARNGLIEAGLISFQARFGRGENSVFSIIGADVKKVRNGNTFSTKKGSEWEHLFDEEKVRNGNTFSNVSSLNSALEEKEENKKGSEWEHLFDENKEEKQEKKNPPPAPPIKQKKEKKKKGLTLPRTHVREDGQFVLFKEDEPIRKKRTPVEQNLPKDMDEVIRFFEKNAAGKLTDWKAEAELFFYHFDSLGWMGTSNRKIQDWESRANLWISDKALKNGEQERRQAEIDARNIRSYGRTTGVPEKGEGGREEPQGRGCSVSGKIGAPKDYTKGF